MSKHTFNSSLDPQLESELDALVKAGGNSVVIMKRICDATGCPVVEAKRWVADHQPVENASCLHCGKLLRTKEARQCFECGMDWHDPERVVRRGV